MKHLIILLILTIFTQNASAQSASQFKKQLKKSVKEIQDSKGRKFVSVYEFRQYITVIPEDILNVLPKYESDTLANVRRLVYDLYDQVGKKNDKPELKQNVVNRLAYACIDKEPSIKKFVAAKLKYYKKADFSEASKNVLANSLNSDVSVYKNTARLIGFLDMQDQNVKITELLNDTSITDPLIKWELQVTLARLGDQDMIKKCIDYAKSLKVNDRVIHFILKDLVYTKQEQCFDYLLEILYSDEKNCRPANPDLYDPIICGYRIMEILAVAVKNFPFETYPGTNQLKADDYDKALETVRQWFKDNPNYLIKKDTF